MQPQQNLRDLLLVAVASGFIDEALRAQAEEAGVRELIFKADEVDVFCVVVQRLLIRGESEPTEQ